MRASRGNSPSTISYWRKWRGRSHGSPPRVSGYEILWSGIGGFVGLLAVSVCALELSGLDRIMVIGSIGASAVLLFGAIRSPLAQPRNLVGGHFLSALTGVSVQAVMHGWPWSGILAPAVAVGMAIALMHLTRTLHPPGGATALVAVIGSDRIHDMGYWFVLFPGLLMPLVLLLVALIFNNLVPKRVYPEFWW